MILKYKSFLEKVNFPDNFQQWFEGSKIVDSNGKPLLLYHGSNNEFTKFDISKSNYNTGNDGHYGKGFYFTQYEYEAKYYGNLIYKCYLRILNPFTGTDNQYLELRNKGWDVGDYEQVAVNIDSVIKQIKEPYYLEFIKIALRDGFNSAWENAIENKNDELFEYLNELHDFMESNMINRLDEYHLNILESIFKVDLSKVEKIYEFTYKTPLHYISDLGNLGNSLREDIIELGYDGVIYNGEYVAFNSEQIYILPK